MGSVAIVSSLLEKIASKHTLNSETLGKIRSILSGIFTYAMGKGHFPGKSASENPCSCALIPESATEPEQTVAATREQVQAILTALKGLPLERAAIAVVAYTGCRPSECRGLRWEESNRVEQQIILDNLSKRRIRPVLEKAGVAWPEWYALRRFLGTAVRMHASSETMAKALGNSKAAAEKHYLKPKAVLPDVRKAVNDAVSGLVQ